VDNFASPLTSPTTLNGGDEFLMIATPVTSLWYGVVTRVAVTVTHHPPLRAGAGYHTWPVSLPLFVIYVQTL
jgi:hypothetical protein